jgi:hypothetical protein
LTGRRILAQPRRPSRSERTEGVRIDFDLSPQLSDVDPKVLRVDQFVPELAAQNFLRHHLTGVLHQDTQQIVFFRRELRVLITHLNDMTLQVDGEIADPKCR